MRGLAQPGELSPICAYVAQRTGTSLSPQQLQRLQTALYRQLEGRSEEEHLAFLQSPAGTIALAELMSSVCVHKTDLFRDEVQLDAFFRHVLRPLVERERRPLRLWSAGCATGEEVATLLILLREAGAHPDSTVLGTDISAAALKEAMSLRFHADLVRRVPAALCRQYFEQKDAHHSLKPELKAKATFVRHNLMDLPYPFTPEGKGFDVIFCRNVLIYFTEDACERVVDAFGERLADGGTLVLSVAEPILRPRPRLKKVRFDQAFFYVRRPGSDPRPSPALPPSPRPRPPAPPKVVAPPPAAPKAEVQPTEPEPGEEASALFATVLEWAAAGVADAQTETGLRRCLYLDPHFAQARYLLGMLLEQQGARADAAAEYRRALAALKENRARPASFFLNNERLMKACEAALKRLGYRR